MISNKINNQLLIAQSLNIRTLFAIQTATDGCFNEKSNFNPDMDFISFHQLESIFQLFDKDIQVFKTKEDEKDEWNSSEFIKSLPSNQLINVGIVYKHSKNSISKF